MIEPTESESKAELDRFCDAMIRIRDEIRAVETGALDPKDNPLKHAPHTAQVLAGPWQHPYTRETAAFPVASLRATQVLAAGGTHRQRLRRSHLVCACPPVSEYEQVEPAGA